MLIPPLDFSVCVSSSTNFLQVLAFSSSGFLFEGSSCGFVVLHARTSFALFSCSFVCLFVGISIDFSHRRCANTCVDRDREMGRRRISDTLSLVFLCP
jgi:hypothetical protein